MLLHRSMQEQSSPSIFLVTCRRQLPCAHLILQRPHVVSFHCVTPLRLAQQARRQLVSACRYNFILHVDLAGSYALALVCFQLMLVDTRLYLCCKAFLAHKSLLFTDCRAALPCCCLQFIIDG
jgi:hypothetical protein